MSETKSFIARELERASIENIAKQLARQHGKEQDASAFRDEAAKVWATRRR